MVNREKISFNSSDCSLSRVGGRIVVNLGNHIRNERVLMKILQLRLNRSTMQVFRDLCRYSNGGSYSYGDLKYALKQLKDQGYITCRRVGKTNNWTATPNALERFRADQARHAA